VTPAEHWGRVVSLLAVDPGAKTGWALYLEAGGWHLAACGVASPTEHEWCPLAPRKIDRVVIENPRIHSQSAARPNDILTLARVVGRYEERFADAKAVCLVEPRKWKGTVDGDIMTSRIRGSLTDQERGAFERSKGDHNTLDAIGLAKWSLLQLPIMRAVR
jgi:hypothetical protein